MEAIVFWADAVLIFLLLLLVVSRHKKSLPSSSRKASHHKLDKGLRDRSMSRYHGSGGGNHHGSNSDARHPMGAVRHRFKLCA
jgi:hypothetical protein